MYRDGVWYIYASTQGLSILQLGEGGDRVAEGDYDLDGKTDEAVWRPGEGVWYIYQSTTGASNFISQNFGLTGDVPVPSAYVY